jgi:hypothetical protein
MTWEGDVMLGGIFDAFSFLVPLGDEDGLMDSDMEEMTS